MLDTATDAAEATDTHAGAHGAVGLGLAQITSLALPSFADPVSQYRSPAQLCEPAFARWQAMLDADDDWPAAFVLQVLERYGALRPAAHGGQFGEAAPRLAWALLQCGAHADRREDLDFGWAVCADAIEATVRLVARRMIVGLRPGGVGVCIFPFGPDAAGRADIERIAIDLIADGHAVAALKFRGADPALTVPFGLVFMRGARA